MPILRYLNPIEQAFAIMHPHYPFCVVSVMELQAPDDLATCIRKALDHLQTQHPAFQATIVRHHGRYALEQPKDCPPIDLNIQAPASSLRRLDIAREAMSSTFPEGPLLRAIYVPHAEPQDGIRAADLMLVFHHVLIDSLSASEILRRLMYLIGEPDAEQEPYLEDVAAPESFSAGYSGREKRRFMLRQIGAELRYSFRGIKSPVPSNGECGLLSYRFSLEESRALSLAAGRHNIGLNSLIAAATLRAVVRQRHPHSHKKLARYIGFVNLRSRMHPAVPDSQPGALISMMRFETRIDQQTSLWDLAQQMNQKLVQAARRQEHLMFADMAPALVRMALKMNRMRLANSALSFMGKLDLPPQVGNLKLQDVRVYISNNPLGPEAGMFGKILFGRIGLDLTYLLAETSPRQAEGMFQDILDSLRHCLANSA